MVLTKPELIDALQHEVGILLHLAGKIDRAWLDYRPTPTQRSILELLQYLTMMGPALVKVATTGRFDGEAWAASEAAAAARDFDQTIAAIGSHAEGYPAWLADLSDEDLRTGIDVFGAKASRGAFLVKWLLGGCVAYRMQLFLYLKACGRVELGTMNLWVGVDAPPDSNG